jgi:hypothetical protein
MVNVTINSERAAGHGSGRDSVLRLRCSAVVGTALFHVFWIGACASASAPDDMAAAEYFEKQVRPVLVAKCQSCHGEKKARGGFRLLSREHVLKGGDSGPEAVPGKPEECRLIEAIEYLGELQMPPDGKLSDGEIARLKRWVAMGLPWPQHQQRAAAPAGTRDHTTSKQERWWSLRPIRVPDLPSVKNPAWIQSEIDRFILVELEARNISPAEPAEKRTLIRRATFDLTGLPPRARDIEEFASDRSPDAFARVVDRLLASTAYGERWGRHWLDVARYADSIQLDPKGQSDSSDFELYEAYRCRDWVVQALNRDMPFDQFIVHQIAGDCLPSPCGDAVYPEGLIASGFLAVGVWDSAEGDKKKLVSDIVDDQIDAIGKGFLGLTLGCARCHDHKFDPISQEDYYGLAGIFYSTRVLAGLNKNGSHTIIDRVPLVAPDYVKKREQQAQKLSQLERRIGQITADLVAKCSEADASTARVVLSDPSGELVKLCRQRQSLSREMLPSPPLALAAQEGGTPGSLFPAVQDVPVHIRGSYVRLGPLVPRRLPVVLAGEHQAPIAAGSGRLELARWIAAKDNPLTARVLVNRVWQHHFGEGIVRTPSNFGRLGEPPSHPGLLDWLAARFIEDGWSLKALHRRIMLSATYQQASTVTAEQFAADVDNRWFGRMNARRLEAEAIRDALLAVTGGLDPTIGGPAVADALQPRRSLYLQTARRDQSNFASLFDGANPDLSVGKRAVSTVVPQALFFLNDRFVWTQARRAAEQLEAAVPERVPRIEEAYRRILGRPARQYAIQLATTFLDRTTPGDDKEVWVDYVHALLCSNEFVYLD